MTETPRVESSHQMLGLEKLHQAVQEPSSSYRCLRPLKAHRRFCGLQATLAYWIVQDLKGPRTQDSSRTRVQPPSIHSRDRPAIELMEYDPDTDEFV